MIAYNVTVRIEPAFEAKWVDWMRKEHIPDVMQTGHFVSVHFAKIIEPVLDEQKTYSVQYRCNSLASLKDYQIQDAARLQAEHEAHFSGNYVSFRSVMEFIEL